MPYESCSCGCGSGWWSDERIDSSVDDYYDDDYDSDSDDYDSDDYDSDDGRLIHSYEYKPHPVFHGDGPLYLGAEIEVAAYNEREVARNAQQWLGDIGYLKSDSSIGGGVEIVTHPMSYRFAMDSFPWDMLPSLQAMGAQATRNTGIHVHVSRAGFASPSHVYRWYKFIYRNEADVVKLARRESDQWAPFTREARRSAKDVAKPPQRRRIIQDRYGYRYNAPTPAETLGRYQAINVTNAETFELRIFASSLDPAEVKTTLAFAAATVEYTRGLTSHDVARHGGWTWPAFTGWAASRPEFGPLHHLALEVQPCVS